MAYRWNADRLKGKDISEAGLNDGDVLVYDESEEEWVSTDAQGDLSGSYLSPQVSGLLGSEIFGTPNDGDRIVWNDTESRWEFAPATQAGDLDHGSLTGLGDDDHTQYLLEDGTRAMSGDLDLGTNNVTNVGNVDGRDVSADGSTLDSHVADTLNPHSVTASQVGAPTEAEFDDHSARHENGGADEINVGGLSGELADPQTPKSHGNEAHSTAFAADADLTAHENDTSNPHSVTASQVGNDTAQWNADRLQGRDVQDVAPGDSDVLTWNDSESRWEPQTPSGGGTIDDIDMANQEMDVLSPDGDVVSRFKAGHALSLDRTQSQYVTLTDAAQTGLGFTGAFTLVAWVRFTVPNDSGYSSIVGKYDTADERAYNFQYNWGNQSLYLHLSDSGTAAESVNGEWHPEIGKWYHLAARFDPSYTALEALILVNGVRMAGGSISFSTLHGSSGNFSIGAQHTSANNTADYLEVGAFSTALSEDEIIYIMHHGLNAAHPDLEGGWLWDGESYDDISGNGNTLTPVNTPEFIELNSFRVESDGLPVLTASGKSVDSHVPVNLRHDVYVPAGGYSSRQEGSYDNRLSITDGNETRLNVTGSLTITAWYKPGYDSGSQSIVSRYLHTNDNRGYVLRQVDGGIFRFNVSHTGDTSGWGFVDADLPIVLGRWYHIAARFDASASQAERMAIFINGEKVAVNSWDQTSIADVDADFVIGNNHDGGWPVQNGNIGEVGVFDAALSDDQIADVMLNGVTMYLDDLAGGWDWRAAAGIDLSRNGNNLDTNGDPLWDVENEFAFKTYDSLSGVSKELLTVGEHAVKSEVDFVAEGEIHSRSRVIFKNMDAGGGSDEGVIGMDDPDAWRLVVHEYNGGGNIIQFYSALNDDGHVEVINDLVVDGQILADIGTTSRPGYSFTGDSNTGIGQSQSNDNAVDIIRAGNRVARFSSDILFETDLILDSTHEIRHGDRKRVFPAALGTIAGLWGSGLERYFYASRFSGSRGYVGSIDDGDATQDIDIDIPLTPTLRAGDRIKTMDIGYGDPGSDEVLEFRLVRTDALSGSKTVVASTSRPTISWSVTHTLLSGYSYFFCVYMPYTTLDQESTFMAVTVTYDRP